MEESEEIIRASKTKEQIRKEHPEYSEEKVEARYGAIQRLAEDIEAHPYDHCDVCEYKTIGRCKLYDKFQRLPTQIRWHRWSRAVYQDRRKRKLKEKAGDHMPKIISDPAADIIIGCARKNKRRTKSELIQRSGITAGTFRNRVLHPEDITIGEFRKLAKESGLEDTDIIEIARYKQ